MLLCFVWLSCLVFYLTFFLYFILFSLLQLSTATTSENDGPARQVDQSVYTEKPRWHHPVHPGTHTQLHPHRHATRHVHEHRHIRGHGATRERETVALDYNKAARHDFPTFNKGPILRILHRNQRRFLFVFFTRGKFSLVFDAPIMSSLEFSTPLEYESHSRENVTAWNK